MVCYNYRVRIQILKSCLNSTPWPKMLGGEKSIIIDMIFILYVILVRTPIYVRLF